ncbi:MAG: hypothetical protein V4819_10355 [Verrucomicrobiota bacterium]
MIHRIASAKAGITPADVAFVESALAASGESVALAKLWRDPDAVTALLDLKEIHRALLESPVALPVSPSLYFYVLVRHAFVDGGIDHPGLADYVAGVLVEKLDSRCQSRPGSMPGWVTHAVDFVSVIQATHGMLRFQLEVAAGDQFLVLTGIFAGFLQQRAERSGAPGTAFYESFARQSYRNAANRPGVAGDTRELLFLLAETFPLARASLNRMTDRCLF